MKDQREHLRAVGVLHVAYGILALIGTMVMMLIVAGIAVPAAFAGSELIPAAITGGFSLLMAGFMLFFFLPCLIGGIGMLRHRPWAPTMLMVASVLNLLTLPLGTALAGYTLWVLWPRTATSAPTVAQH